MCSDVVVGSEDSITLFFSNGVVNQAEEVLVFETPVLLECLYYLFDVVGIQSDLFEKQVFSCFFIN